MIVVKIIKGKGKGKSILGYATANAITNNQKLFGKEGSWYVGSRVDGVTYKAVCGICKKSDGWVLETHILDFNEDLYDESITIDFIHKIREQITFKGLDESRTQLEKDIDFVRRYRSCNECKFCVFQDHGYSNYTVEGTDISCLAGKFEQYGDGYGDDYKIGRATDCEYFNEGPVWSLDVDGEVEAPSEDWIKSEMIKFQRDIKLKSILDPND